MSVRYTADARRDLDGISEHIAAYNLDAAIRFCMAVEDATEKLEAMPGMGSLKEFAHPKLQGMRSWSIKGFENYLIFYVPTKFVPQATKGCLMMIGPLLLPILAAAWHWA